MRYRFAITSGAVFAITWPRIHNPAARSCLEGVAFRLRSGSSSFGSNNTPSTTAFCRNIVAMSASNSISYNLLKEQSAATSNALMQHWENSTDFEKLANYEGNMTVARDKEDDEKLQVGIDYAKNKGVIDPNFVPEPYVTIDVLGKTPNQVADTIIANVKENDSQDGGFVVVLVGLSGTGKGTTVAALRHKLEQDEGKQVVTWSNGNIFRSVTLLAVTWCEQNGCDGFDAEKALTKENIAEFMSMLTFDKFHGKYDTRIHGLGLDMMVSQVQNTELKSPKVSKNIPTVAEVTQGEVILFAANAVNIMGKDGLVVLLEGREQTVNYVRTPYRFALVLSDESLIGKRRAAQRIMADALKNLPASGASDEQVTNALDASLNEMVAEVP